MKYDLILPIAEPDYEVAKKSIPFLTSYLGADHIILIGNSAIKKYYEEDFGNDEIVEYIHEDELIDDLSFDAIKKIMNSLGCHSRVGWYFQQFIKMGYAKICGNDYYLSWDSDMIPLNKIQFADKDSVPYFSLKKEYNKAYFDTIFKLFGLNKKTKDSFIAEHMFFNKNIMMEMLNAIESKFNKRWYQAILENINFEDLPKNGFSEFETYGTYTMEYHPEAYNVRRLKAIRCGRRIFGDCPNADVLRWLGKSFDTISFEKWDENLIETKIYNSALFRKLVPSFLFVKLTFLYIKLFRKGAKK